MQIRGLLIGLFLFGSLSGCAEPESEDVDRKMKPSVEQDGQVAILRAGRPGDGAYSRLQISVDYDDATFTCSRAIDGKPVHYLVYESREGRHAYGVYGLGGYKNRIPIDRPLDGDAIPWKDRNTKQALSYLLSSSGISGEEAESLVERRAESFFRDGLHFFFILPRDKESDETAKGSVTLLVISDFEAQ